MQRVVNDGTVLQHSTLTINNVYKSDFTVQIPMFCLQDTNYNVYTYTEDFTYLKDRSKLIHGY
jgi:hypothetical protein